MPTGRPSQGREVGLGGVLDHGQPVPAGDVADPVHRGGMAVEVHRHDRRGARGDRRLDGGRVEAEVVGLDVGEDRAGAGERHRVRRGGEAERRDDDLVARPDAEREQRELQGAGARVHRHARAVLDVLGELGLERGDLGALREHPGREHAFDGGAFLLPELDPRRRHLQHAPTSMRRAQIR